MNKSGKIWKCMVADDEPLAREVISRYISRVHTLELVAECSNAIEVMETIQQQQIDLIFLDIHMPEISGTELLRILKNPPSIIITTAYQEYALEGYELDVVDYLLKPIKFERFLKAINKLFLMKGDAVPAPLIEEKQEAQKESYLFFRTDRKTVKVMLNEILYVEGMGNYVKIFTETETIITKNSMTTVETMLPEDLFLRTHRSFIVARSKVKSFNNEILFIGKTEIPIGKHFKNEVVKILSRN